MKANFFSFIRTLINPDDKDVFKSTQSRLTRMYSGILILFLTLFILIVYSVLYVVITKNQEQELQSLAQQEADFLENYLLKNEKSDFHGMQDQEVVFAGVNQFFYYVVNPNGEIIMGSETDRRLGPELQRLVNSPLPNGGTVRKETLHMNGSPKGRGNRGGFRPPVDQQDIHLMIASDSIYYKGQLIGQLYIGKDISFADQLFRWILFILIAIGVIFFGVALSLSTVMSKRAMVPISGAFKRQREFVGDASHELRTPLSVLLSSIDAIEMTIELDREDLPGKMLTNMREEVKRMTHLVSDLLTLARSDSNTIEHKVEVFDFSQHAEKTVEALRTLADSKQISLELSAPPSLTAMGDVHRLSQLLYILIDNAIKYTSNGGTVRTAVSEQGNQLCIAVQDTGIGIKQEDVQRIFERFYRADKSRSRQMGGHGLGLSIAKWIVETHKGTIHVTSEWGKGSTFVVRIPRV